MKKILLITITLLLVGCSLFRGAKNNKYAYYSFDGSTYTIELSGERVYMAHEIISALKSETYPVHATFIVPKIKGVVKGRDIINSKSNFSRYVGTIKFNGNKMLINLENKYFDNETPNSSVAWNGEYILVKK